MLRTLIGLTALATLMACSGGNNGQTGPDEFLVLPTRPLTYPETNALPVPTPGGTNPTDPNPVGQAIAALGGTQSGVTGAIPASDGALVTQAGRYGTTANVRVVAATEEAQLRGRGRVRYSRAQTAQAIDPYAETQRYRGAGVAVPTVPPQN